VRSQCPAAPDDSLNDPSSRRMRLRDAMEFAAEMEDEPARAAPPARRPQILLERARVRFWQGVAALLALALLISLWQP
jgi:hypothetical protein